MRKIGKQNKETVVVCKLILSLILFLYNVAIDLAPSPTLKSRRITKHICVEIPWLDRLYMIYVFIRHIPTSVVLHRISYRTR